ncbi:MAG: LysE family transporter [Oscillospiraceae bacterium]
MDISAMLLYMAVTMFTPGPNNLTMLYLSAQYGFRGTWKYFLGSASGLLAKTLLCGGLNVLLADLLPVLVEYLKWLGAAYMLYLAWVMGRSGFRSGEEAEARSGGATFGAGVLLQCLNMKSWVSALTLFAVYVVPHSTAPGVIAAASLAFLAMMAAASALWGLFGSALHRLCSTYKKPFGLLMAASLVYCAATAVL